ncbi:MAG: hypothetical protein HY059_19180 [Proteobacteria bacterium]|nr:hypothetical protein [Pseudomonadota bacterium]
MRHWAWSSLLLLAGAAAAQATGASVHVTSGSSFEFGARWLVEFDLDAGPYRAGTRLECRVDEPPDQLPRALVTCLMPDGSRASLGEPDGSQGVLPIDVHVRSLRLTFGAGSR